MSEPKLWQHSEMRICDADGETVIVCDKRIDRTLSDSVEIEVLIASTDGGMPVCGSRRTVTPGPQWRQITDKAHRIASVTAATEWQRATRAETKLALLETSVRSALDRSGFKAIADALAVKS
jgi:hypothetical protein